MNRRILMLPFVVFLLLASLVAQTPSQSSTTDPARLVRSDSQQRSQWAREWLSSDDSRHVAWGAWLAKQDNLKDLIPELIRQVREYQPIQESLPKTDRDRHDALLVVLDALIALRAQVPAEDTRKLYPEFPAQTMILLVRASDDNQPAMAEIFREAKANWNWLAAGNVLLNNRTPGFAALLLERFTQHLEVTVTDPGVGGGWGGGASECMLGLGGPKSGWPPVGHYYLTQFPQRFPSATETYLVGGVMDVYYLRDEHGSYRNQTDNPGACDDGSRDQYRAEYLRRLTEFSSFSIKIEAYPKVTIVWKDEADFRQTLLAAVADQRTQFGRAVASLEDSGKLLAPAEAASLHPRIELVIRDQRKNQSASLPPVLNEDASIVVRPQFSRPLN